MRSNRSARTRRRGLLPFEWLLVMAIVAVAVILGFEALRGAFLSYLAPIPHCMCAIDVECTPCDGDTPCDPNQANCGRPPWYCATCNP